MSLSLGSRVVRRSHPLEAEVGESHVLLDAERGLYFGLDPVAADIWRRLEAPVGVDTLCRSLGETYDAPPARIEADVLAFLARLEAQHLLEVLA